MFNNRYGKEIKEENTPTARKSKVRSVVISALIVALMAGGIFFISISVIEARENTGITVKGKWYPTSLRDLDLSEDYLSDEDILPLQRMADLNVLKLASNKIGDISSLSGLANLRILELYSNQISDISSLSGLTVLSSLNLSDNQISDISPLSGLTNLGYLDLSGNPITDWSPVAHIEDVDGRP